MRAPTLKGILLKIIGLLFCTVPPIAAVLCYFPVWQAKGGEAVLSGFTLLLLLLSLVPFFSTVKRLLRSPAAHTMWFIAFVSFFILSSIAEEMTVIAFVGFIGNLIGAILFKISERREVSKDEEQL